MATKLVRDRIRDVPGFVPCSSDNYRPVVDADEHEALLLKKMHEELGELIEARAGGYAHEINAEGADLVDVVLSFLVVSTDISEEQVMRLIQQKRDERGSFFGGLVWEHP
jgi:predicted house-cleaning noncanonical NTP pyrophosphatase (MazG superfamily)